MLSDLAVRAFSAFCIGVPFVLAVYAGWPYFDILLVFAAALLAWEWFRLVLATEALRANGLAFLGGVSAGVVVAALAPVWLAIAAVVVATCVVFVASGRNRWLAAGVPYLALPCISLLWLRHHMDGGLATVFWLLAVVWASDIGAYFSGRLIGGPKLAPAVSPNKTWAGFAGGAVAAALAGAISVAIDGRGAVWPIVVVSVMVGICAQGGDLLESWMKRHFGVKDTSRLIPGHGGVLDRVDGLMTAAVLLALIAALGKGTMFG